MIEVTGFGFRFLELGVLIFAVVLSVLSFIRVRKPGLVWVSAIAMLVLLGHLVLEQARWQLVPLYVVVFAASIWISIPTRRKYRAGGLVLRIVLVVVVFVPALLLPLAVPFFRVPPPTGPHPVGSVTLAIQADPGTVTIRYPAAPKPAPSSFWESRWWRGTTWSPVRGTTGTGYLEPYWSLEEISQNRLPGYPGIASSHLATIATNSELRAARAEGPFPLLVLIPAAETLPSDYLVLAEQAASLGWIVLEAPPGTSGEDLVGLLEAGERGFRDTAFEDAIDTNRAVILGVGWDPDFSAGLPTVSVGGETLFSVVTPVRRYGLSLPDARYPVFAESNRYLLLRPPRLLLGSSDIPPSVLSELVRKSLSAVLTDGSIDSPVFSGVPGAVVLADTTEAFGQSLPNLVIEPSR